MNAQKPIKLGMVVALSLSAFTACLPTELPPLFEPKAAQIGQAKLERALVTVNPTRISHPQ